MARFEDDQQVRAMKTATLVPREIGMAEADLVSRAQARDEAALRAIMQANNRRLYRLARGILRNDSEAEDVVQETYVRAFTHLDGFRGEASLSTWLSRIAINEALARAKREKPNVEIRRRAGERARGPDHPVSFRRRRPGKIHGPT
jgi:RNA polymerase sigma-70 factor (ECF subfamily)